MTRVQHSTGVVISTSAVRTNCDNFNFHNNVPTIRLVEFLKEFNKVSSKQTTIDTRSSIYSKQVNMNICITNYINMFISIGMN